MKPGVLLPLLFLVISGVNVAWGQSATEQLRDFNRQVQSMQANFEQTLFDAEGEIVQQASGEVYIKRPGKFRWDYVLPAPQQLVADGMRFWIYDSDLEQVTVKSTDEALGTAPALVLTGRRDLNEDFIIKEQGLSEGLNWVELFPRKQDTEFTRVRIGFDPELRVMELIDNFGQRTHIRFNDLQRNVAIDNSRFEFNIPPGVDVIGDAP